ncbi:Flagellar motor switch protein FliG [Crateriforma conspicua]|uniref:Flagellar motor switch protein FliG n=1 Tax=Crateriforma conspicua TaxID=2527996 RepID=A0A5C5Y5F7_9PLAN|nr:Flagellar motor switch protein FliG [Crateriforma conspicua]TWT69891.1 Flagellar motor switch protein FliG [Crateriforma conspicua]
MRRAVAGSIAETSISRKTPGWRSSFNRKCVNRQVRADANAKGFLRVQTVNTDNDGLRKAAILLMSLPTKSAARIMQQLPPRLIEQISIRIAQTESVGGDDQEIVIAEFLTSKASSIYASPGGLERAKELIKEALGRDASELIGNLQQTIESMPFAFVKKVDSQTLMQFIGEEHPQTIALLLSHVPASYAAEVLGGLDSEKQLDVIRRVASIGRTSPDAIEELEYGLEQRLSSMVNQSHTSAGGVESVAEILNVCERSVERMIMESLGRDEPELSDDIRRLMFVFEDIAKLGDRDIQALLKNVETAQWAMALKGASETLQEKVMKNMSSRAAENLKDEMGFLGSVRVSEVESVQQKIVDIVRHLEDTGEISRPTGENEEEYVN